MKISPLTFALVTVKPSSGVTEIQAAVSSIADAALGRGEIVRTKIKVDTKPTNVKVDAYPKYKKRAETEAEPEPTPVEETEDGPDECPCGHCGKGARTSVG